MIPVVLRKGKNLQHVILGEAKDLLLPAFLAVATFVLPSALQGQASNPPRSTQSGVYSADQAARGANVYAGMCRSCHTAESHAGATFEKLWNGHPLSDLFSYISTRMPKNEPGSLAPEEYADVLAYLLKMNEMPAGASELAADSAQLSVIRIETQSSASKPHNR